eukprot:SAG31_NODE_46857_length_252_cov_1.352941_1_plen_53_part_01
MTASSEWQGLHSAGAFCWNHVFDCTVLQPTFSWESVLGENGSLLLDVANKYDF